VLAFNGQPVFGPLAALLELQFAVASLYLIRGAQRPGPDPAAQWRVQAVVAELCARAGCPPPRVMVIGGGTRPIGVRAGRGRQPRTLLISRDQVDRLGDRELRAVLAHEVIHLRHNDLAAARWRVIGGQVVGLALLVGSLILAPNPVDYPIWMAGFVVGAVGGTTLLSLSNRPTEMRADAEGALLSGDPAGLARGLVAVRELSDDHRRRLYRPPSLRWLLWPWSLRMPSHPPLATRLARLHAMASSPPEPLPR
jgi:Zn-dependent protease with chaperone function